MYFWIESKIYPQLLPCLEKNSTKEKRTPVDKSSFSLPAFSAQVEGPRFEASMWKNLEKFLDIPVNKDKYDFEVYKKQEMLCLPVSSTGAATSAPRSSSPASTQKNQVNIRPHDSRTSTYLVIVEVMHITIIDLIIFLIRFYAACRNIFKWI